MLSPPRESGRAEPTRSALRPRAQVARQLLVYAQPPDEQVIVAMQAKLIEGETHRPLIRFADGQVGVPVNLRFRSRGEFLGLLGREVIVVSRLSEQHYSVRLPGGPAHLTH